MGFPCFYTTQGVSILIAKSLNFKSSDIVSDPQDKVFLYTLLFGQLLLIIAYYVSPPYNSVVLSDGFSYMTHHPIISAIWLGNFNTTLNPSLDRLDAISSLTLTKNPGLYR